MPSTDLVASPSPPAPWPGDALGRQPLAQHLTRSLVAQALRLARQNRGLTVSLDAPWGAGKSFFVRCWVDDLRAAGHPVVYFDAWENDIGEEAAVALMAAILHGLDNWEKQIPKGRSALTKAKELQSTAVKTLRRSVVPALGVIAQGIFQKSTGIAVDRLTEAWSDAHTEQTLHMEATVEKILDKLFEKSLLEHNSRKENLKKFRQSIHALLTILDEHTQARLPVFVFIDELDRCRPSYAIKLLEEVKHIFGIKQVVFVVSTHMAQLANSARSIYGGDFDGVTYLKRLFDREYVLPTPDNARFAGYLLRQDDELLAEHVFPGLPRHPLNERGVEQAFGLIATAFELDLRSQMQLFALVGEVFHAMPAGRCVHALWLIFLCALYYKDKPLLELTIRQSLDGRAYRARVESSFRTHPVIEHLRTWPSPRQPAEVRQAPLAEIITAYYEWSAKSERELLFEVEHGDLADYPEHILRKITEALDPAQPSYTRRHDIGQYAAMVRTAGFTLSR